MNFYDFEFNITQVVLACKVPAGSGEAVHKNRPSHGLALNISGEKKYIFDDVSITVKDKDIIFLPENSNYVVETIIPGDCYAINFKLDCEINFNPFITHQKNYTEIYDIFISAEKAFKTKKKGYMLKCKSELYSLLYNIINEHYLKYIPTSKEKLILPATKYIHNFYSDKEIKISTLSELCGMKESYFRRIFLNCFGVSPIKYINNLKLMRAKELLLQSEYPLETVSELSGFNNVYYFCRYFKRSTGLTPGEYKKTHT